MDSNIQAAPWLEFDFENNGYLKILRSTAIHGGSKESTALFAYILEKIVPLGPSCSISWEYYPDSNLTGLVVTKLFKDEDFNSTFARPPAFFHICLSVGIRWLADDSEILAAEQQLFVACEYFAQIYGRDEIWGITHTGPKFRIWSYQKGRPILAPLFPLPSPKEEADVFGKDKVYLDLVDSGPQFKRGWEYMIKNPRPDPGLFNAHLDWIKGNGSNECPGNCMRTGFH